MQFEKTDDTHTIRVLVADSSRIHTQLLADALERTEELNVVCSVLDGSSLPKVTKVVDHDVAIVSANIDGEMARGFDLIRNLRACYPALKIIVLTDSPDRDSILEAFRAGARGIFRRQEPVETLCKCVRAVYEGQIWATSEQMSYAVEALAAAPTVRAVDANGFSLLSKRELQVVQSLSEGLTNREIADQLGLSQHTIKNYLFRIFDKLGVSNRIELLFMTLSHAGSPLQNDNSRHNGGHDGTTVAIHVKAAEQGFPGAQFALAGMYAEGDGTPKDPAAAYMWYLISEQSSTELRKEAAAARRRLSAVLNAEQISAAQQNAITYLKKVPQAQREIEAASSRTMEPLRAAN
jgi:two-component system nitrate/nitrite response regulator NarL